MHVFQDKIVSVDPVTGYPLLGSDLKCGVIRQKQGRFRESWRQRREKGPDLYSG